MSRLGSLIACVLITAFVSLMFMAVLAVFTMARAQQGNMPKPVHKLPAYPPAVCVTTNWRKESCADRSVICDDNCYRNAFAWLDKLVPPVIIRHDEGGVIKDYVERYERLKDRIFVIDGDCNSACTLVLGRPHVCATARGRFNFHAAQFRETGAYAAPGTKLLMDTYPETVRAWINANGGLTKQWLTVPATMFVDKCT